jgi:Holliday junction resolvase RusA-like endonuclease
MFDLEFFVAGIPKPGGSKKAFVNKYTGRANVVDDSKGSKPWKACVSLAAAEAMTRAIKTPLEGCLAVKMTFYLPRPKGHFGSGKNAGVIKASAPPFPGVKPDLLKLARSTEDALTGIVWRDDAQICWEILVKEYSGVQIGVRITVNKMLDKPGQM